MGGFYLQKGTRSADEKEILLCSMKPAGALTVLDLHVQMDVGVLIVILMVKIQVGVL